MSEVIANTIVSVVFLILVLWNALVAGVAWATSGDDKGRRKGAYVRIFAAIGLGAFLIWYRGRV